MSQEQMGAGEGFGVSKTPGGGSMSTPTIEEQKKQLRKKIGLWGSVSAIALAVFGYAFFGQLVPSVKQYRLLLKQEAVATKEVVKWSKIQKRADGSEIVVASGSMPAEDFRDRPLLRGYLTVKAFRPDPAGAYLKVGSEILPVRYSWTDSLIGTAWAAGERYKLFDERGPLRNLIVDAGEQFLVDAWQNIVELEIMKYHGIGTSTASAAEANTGCTTELTTEYNPDSTRATGSLTEGTATNIFRTVGTNTVDAAVAITEWCLMSQAATGGGTMWSRVVFSAVNLSSGDSLQTTYDLTVE